MSEVQLNDVVKRYGSYVAVAGVTLTVKDGEFLTLLGPSGCGKTTTLRMIAGFVQPDSGTVRIGNADVSNIPSYRRNTGMVFQTYALFPHLTVEQNVAFGLRFRKVAKAEAVGRVKDALRLVHLSELGERFPRQLSGGQQQRVALARAVVINPEILLLDEPLGALDLKLRQELQTEIKRVQKELGITTLYVTHDQGEALSLSDRIAVMHSGRVLQLDSPATLYEQPNSAFVANFVGRTNTIDVDVLGFDIESSTYSVRAIADESSIFSVKAKSNAGPIEIGKRSILGFRPERASINRNGQNRLRARVDKSSYFGSTWSVSLTSPLAQSLSVEQEGYGTSPGEGDHVDVTWDPSACFLLRS